jgi:uncharacterized membrane protein (UPF0127 family)
MIFKYKNRQIEFSARQVSFLGKFIGLMFHTKNSENLLFKFKKNTSISIHSFFVFFKFLAVWTDEDYNVIDFKIVKPFKLNIIPKKSFRNLIEIPLNESNKNILYFFVGER